MAIYDLEKIIGGIKQGDRHLVGKAITLLESKNITHKNQAANLLNNVISRSGNAIRIGISGTPGVGKSTFIESFGMELIKRGHKVAVLAIDPSSPINGGSIMGDKTRMTELSAHDSSFIRPSPSSGTLGGVARKTREVGILLEASGYDVILIETVGVGQSEVVCASMVDIFVMLQLPNAGDELQGIKKGILELADVICINKSDGDFVTASQRTKVELQNALHLVRHDNQPTILNISALKKEGIKETADSIFKIHSEMTKDGSLTKKRSRQASQWFKEELDHQFLEHLRSNKKTNELYKELSKKVTSGELAGSAAAHTLSQKIFDQLKK
jgi:LAO/AO transport system kinase